ncbi:MAG: ribonuclease E/G [Lachnospiraceae bacterium]|nr:ribonuclease E/G [Lachnospiraceae bacterium]
MTSETGKLLLTPYQNKILSLLFKDNRLLSANAFLPEGSLLNNIYIGKVTNIVKNIDAAFVETCPGQICFLPLKECQNAVWVNRSFNEKLVVGDEIIVQVVKEAVKTKQPVLSANLAFTGTYCVVTTGKRHIGFSSKLTEELKTDLKKYIGGIRTSLNREKFGYVLRTNCRELHGNYEPLKKELETLTAKAEDILDTAMYKTCYSRLFAAPVPYLSQLQSLYRSEYDEIITDDKEIYETLCNFRSSEENKDENGFSKKIRLYEDAMLPLQKLYCVETRLSEALSKNVWLKSGGYLVIEPTEALTVIDVNTGKSIGKKNVWEHYFKINMEAAEEIALQLRLRNISGMILVDFINMQSKEQDEVLVQKLRTLLKEDSVKTDVIDITGLGLVEITRKKKDKPLWEQLK